MQYPSNVNIFSITCNMKEVEKVELDLFFFFATLQFQLPFFIFINMDFGENSEVHFLTLSLTADNLNQ